MRFKFVFYSKGIRQLKQLKLSLLFDVIPHPFPFGIIWNNLFHDLNYVWKHKQFIFTSFLTCKTLTVIITLFFSNFIQSSYAILSNILIKNFFLPNYIYVLRFDFCYSLQIIFDFCMI